eukprot:5186470-Lingulodinium_polyedra.AAC.1
MALAQVLTAVVRKSNESVKMDVAQKGFELRREEKYRLRGRHIFWMILDFFKTKRTLQQQSVFQVLRNVKWMGGEKIEDFFRTYRRI